MLIAHRNGMLVETGWKNPYITDGLVAMWDGEWNKAGGVHDANATVWKDLVGGTSATIGSGNSFGDNYLHVVVATSRWIPTKDLINNNQGFTIEAVGNQGLGSGSSGIWYFGSSAVAFTAYPQFSPGRAYMSAFGRSLSGASMTLASGRSLSGAVTYDGITAVLYAPWANKSTSTAFSKVTETQDSMLPGNSQYIHSIRLYNRALTAQEIAANYAIDVARFNLPTA